jgi:hypothetical protein
MDVGALLEWTPAAMTDTYMENGLPFSCVTQTNFNVKADKVPAVDHAKCKP